MKRLLEKYTLLLKEASRGELPAMYLTPEELDSYIEQLLEKEKEYAGHNVSDN